MTSLSFNKRTRKWVLRLMMSDRTWVYVGQWSSHKEALAQQKGYQSGKAGEL